MSVHASEGRNMGIMGGISKCSVYMTLHLIVCIGMYMVMCYLESETYDIV